MSLSSRLVFPVVIGGLIAMIASGIFTPPVMALSQSVAELAQITPADEPNQLYLRNTPRHSAPSVGSLAATSWVWVDHCVENGDRSNWCLVERGQTKGWIDSRHLTVRWN